MTAPSTYFFELPPYGVDAEGRAEWLRPYVEQIAPRLEERVRRGLVLFSANVYTALLHYFYSLRNDLQTKPFQLFKEFVQSKQFQSVHVLTRYDPYYARTTALAFALELAKKVQEDKELQQIMRELSEGGGCDVCQIQQGQGQQSSQNQGQQSQGQGQQQGQSQSQSQGGSQQQQGQQGQQQSQEQRQQGSWRRLVEKLGQIMEAASQNAKIANEFPGRGWDESAGQLVFSLATQPLPAVVVSELERVFIMSRQILHIFHSKFEPAILGEIAGYRTTSNLAHALPSELADETIFEVKLAQGSLLTHDKRLKNRSDVLLLLDKSGSMAGARIAWAKAVALALYKALRAHGVKVAVIFFDHNVYPPMQLPQHLKELLTVEASGGTSIENAVRAAIQFIEKGGRPHSVVLLSDIEAPFGIADSVVKRLKELRSKLSVVMLQSGFGSGWEVRRVVKETGGVFAHVRNADALSGAEVLKIAFRSII